MMLAHVAWASGVEANGERQMQMALIDELTAVRRGDLPSRIKRDFGKRKVKAADHRMAEEMFAGLGGIGKDYLELWQDYECRGSLEAKIVKAADKLDLLLQSVEYEKGGA